MLSELDQHSTARMNIPISNMKPRNIASLVVVAVVIIRVVVVNRTVRSSTRFLFITHA